MDGRKQSRSKCRKRIPTLKISQAWPSLRPMPSRYTYRPAEMQHIYAKLLKAEKRKRLY